MYIFKAKIYKTGINFCVDVPRHITSKLTASKGYIRIKGTVNGYPFTKSLVPVKGGDYRLFINIPTLKGANTGVDKIAEIGIEQDLSEIETIEYPMPPRLLKYLRQHDLSDAFNSLSKAIQKNILKYLSSLKNEETIERNTLKVITQLQQRIKNVRIP